MIAALNTFNAENKDKNKEDNDKIMEEKQ